MSFVVSILPIKKDVIRRVKTPEAEFDQRELFSLYGLRGTLLTVMRNHVVSQAIHHTEKLFSSGEIKEIFAQTGANGLMVNGSAGIPKTLRASGDLDISVIHNPAKNYSLSGARTAMDRYADRIGELLPGKPRIVKMEAAATGKWQELAKKYGYQRYYIVETLNPRHLAALQKQGAVTSEQIEEARNATKAICPKAVGDDGSITFVTLVDAGINSPQHFLLPVDRHGETINFNFLSNAFSTQLSYLRATEEGVRKFCAVLDPTRNLNPMVFAKDVFDMVARNNIIGESNNYPKDDITRAHFNVGSLFRDVLLLSLPTQRWFSKEHKIPNFKRIDPQIRDNIMRLAKGLSQLKENGYIAGKLGLEKEGQPTEVVDVDSEEMAKRFLELIWKICEMNFDVKRNVIGNKPTYTIEANKEMLEFWDAAVKFDSFAPKPVNIRFHYEVPSTGAFQKFMNEKINELAALARPLLASQYHGRAAEELSHNIATTIALARNESIKRRDIRD